MLRFYAGALDRQTCILFIIIITTITIMIIIIICVWQHICYSALYVIAHPSICLSVCLSDTWVDQSKVVEIRITQLSPQSSPMTLFSWRLTSPWNSKENVGSRALN